MPNAVLSQLADLHANAMNDAVTPEEELLWLSFPDHRNIGDSAIWLGERAWAANARIRSAGVLPIRAASPKVLRKFARNSCVAILRGGGFFGGLYPEEDLFRIEVARAFREGKVVQAAQSVADVDPPLTTRVIEALSEVRKLDFFVRDEPSRQLLDQQGIQAKLIPDAAHLLGPLDVGRPIQRTIFLVRRDDESNQVNIPRELNSVDWPTEGAFLRRLRQAAAEVCGTVGLLGVPGVPYDSIAERRLARGLTILSAGETIVTDRLHAMILGLQLGRRVVAIDNRVKKLSRYRESWLSSLPAENLTLVDSLDEGLHVAQA